MADGRVRCLAIDVKTDCLLLIVSCPPAVLIPPCSNFSFPLFLLRSLVSLFFCLHICLWPGFWPSACLFGRLPFPHDVPSFKDGLAIGERSPPPLPWTHTHTPIRLLFDRLPRQAIATKYMQTQTHTSTYTPSASMSRKRENSRSLLELRSASSGSPDSLCTTISKKPRCFRGVRGT